MLIHTYLSTLFDWLLETTIMASILVGFILCVKVLLRNQLTARWHYALWLILIVRLILPWSPDSSYSLYSILSHGYVTSTSLIQKEANVSDLKVMNEPAKYAVNSNDSNKSLVESSSKEKVAKHISMYEICLYVWILGVFCLGALTLIANRRLYLYIQKQPIITDERILNIFEGCKETMSIKEDIPVQLAGKIASPTLLGFRKPRILLCEQQIQRLNDNQLRFIFYHELAHFKRKDVGVNWLMHHLLILNWFNPILWYAYYSMREDQEIACDALALTFIDSEEKIEYGHTIITLLEHYSNYYQMPSLANLSKNKKALKRRIVMIKKFNKKSYRWSALGLTAVLGISAFSLMNASAEELKNESQATKNKIEQAAKPEEMNNLEKSKAEEVAKQSEMDKLEKSKAEEAAKQSEMDKLEQSKKNTEISEAAVLKLTEKQKQYLKSKGLPLKQTSKESEVTGRMLVSLVKPVDNGDGTGFQPDHVGEVDIIHADEYQNKYGKEDYVAFAAWE
ncbi:M56 family metallopeptidase [Bacillus wiedmannii]|uniref:M56 family metallopeptidase n=1 Tax=Bacillus wiedmannii TaxID=1890302 RepID=UPI000BF45158|nr:M56 family metallopeptidase [Bacillus wiedmannii]PFZ56641.1 methicillin resistance protein [Bacillus wiedmannii]PHB64232.1 methicillin resistance protein [Bacillus wiedmannii]PHF23953.1 methicillin resistance protein [Bacillus wiedmannii]PHG61955.1 methicillin resistance protein [Bacillus wiedmannii]